MKKWLHRWVAVAYECRSERKALIVEVYG